MKPKLIITAHDFGMSASVNAGILHAFHHTQNIFTELSLLPNAPGSMEAAQLAHSVGIPVNLCVCLTSFRPLLKTHKTLVDSAGNFIKPNISTWDFSMIDNFDDGEVVAEIAAQYKWFIANVGRKPTALVTQKSEHGDPKILLPLVDLAKRENLPVRTPVWNWRENYGAQSYVEQEKIRHTNNIFIGIKNWTGKHGYDLEVDLDQLIKDIKNKPGVSELLIFAGFVDREIFDVSTVNWQRGQFLQLLDRPEIIDKIKDNFDLISYRDL